MVSVPVSVTILVPIEVDVAIPEESKEPSEELGCVVVDPTDCPDAMAEVLRVSQVSVPVTKAFDALMSAGMRYKEAFPNSNVYYTPYAGLVKEQKL